MKELLEASEVLLRRMQGEIEIHRKDATLAHFGAFEGLSVALECLLSREQNYPEELEDRRAELYRRYEAAHGYEYQLRRAGK